MKDRIPHMSRSFEGKVSTNSRHREPKLCFCSLGAHFSFVTDLTMHCARTGSLELLMLVLHERTVEHACDDKLSVVKQHANLSYTSRTFTTFQQGMMNKYISKLSTSEPSVRIGFSDLAAI